MTTFLEALRLLRKFFPEAKPFISDEQGIKTKGLLQAMAIVGLRTDFSCNPYNIHKYNATPPSFQSKGGFDLWDEKAYELLIQHCNFSPTGRALLVHDMLLQKEAWYTKEHQVIICDSKNVAQRIEEYPENFFTPSSDTLIAFESGEIILVDHDERIFWSSPNL